MFESSDRRKFRQLLEIEGKIRHTDIHESGTKNGKSDKSVLTAWSKYCNSPFETNQVDGFPREQTMKTKPFHNRTRSKTAAALLVVTLLVWNAPFASAQSGATVYGGSSSSPASLQYSSLDSGVGSLGSLGQLSNTSSQPLVAQAYSTAPVSSQPAQIVQPVVTSPTLTTGTVVQPNLTSPTLLQPMDPYAVPTSTSLFGGSGSSTASTPLFNSGNFGSQSTAQNYGQSSTASGVYSGNFDRFVPETYDAMRRFREATSFEFLYLPGGNKSNSFGLTEIDLRMQLAIPCRFIPTNGTGQGFFYVAPGGGVAWWDGPVGPPDMSPNGFKAFLDFGVRPQFNDVFGLNAWFRFGVFSDFKDVSSKSLRYQGRIEGIFNVSREVQIFAGIIYMDRARVKIMPTGGVVWTPRDDLVLKLVFPNPKISKRLWNNGNSEWWGYVQADYGGDSWSIKGLGKTDYNDIRVGIGLEFETISRVGGYFEFGGSFGREIYSNHTKWASPPDVIYLKTGFVF